MTALYDGITAKTAQARRELAARLEPLDAASRVTEMRKAVRQSGGYLFEQGTGGSLFAELNCLGIYHHGNDTAEAVAGWIKAIVRIESEAA